MLRKTFVLVVLLALLVPAALAGGDEAEKKSGEYLGMGWGLFAGYLWGDELTEKSLPDADGNGSYTPTLDDDFLVGGMFYVDNTPNLRFEFRLSWSPNTVLDTPKGDISMDVLTLDVVAVPHWNRGRWEFGIPVGFGWSVSRTDENLADRIPGRSKNLRLEDGSGMDYFLGLQSACKMGEKWAVFAEYRLHRYHRLVNVIERTAKCEEFVVGFRRSF